MGSQKISQSVFSAALSALRFAQHFLRRAAMICAQLPSVKREADHGQQGFDRRLGGNDACQAPQTVEQNDGRNEQDRIAQDGNGKRMDGLSQCLKIAGNHIDDPQSRR